MKDIFKPSRLAFYILTLILFFMLGLYYAWWTDAGKNQGLAGGAIVLGWGVAFGGIAFISSFFVAAILSLKVIRISNWIMLTLVLAVILFTYIRFSTRQRTTEPNDDDSKPLPVAPANFNRPTNKTTAVSADNIGLGFFKPNFNTGFVLYFYGSIDEELGNEQQIPIDSLVFSTDEHGNLSTSYAPPWLFPEHLKLDYGIVFFKALGARTGFVKVIVNKSNGQTAYLKRSSGQLQYWPEFLLSVNSVELIDDKKHKIHLKPIEIASEVNVEYGFMQPLQVGKDWMYVNLLNNSFEKVGAGWIRWRDNDKLLITYALLS